MKYILLPLLILQLFLISCSTVRDSAGVTRKSIDEFKVIENPPLIIPPDFNLLPPDQLMQKNIDDIDQDLAKEILFGLDEESNKSLDEVSAMNDILSNTNASSIPNSIRQEIDEDFAKEKDTESIFQIDWKNEVEVLDAIKESERIRNQKFEGKSIADGDVPIKQEVIKVKKKKRFFFF